MNVIHLLADFFLALCCTHKVSLRSSIKMDFMKRRKAGLLKFYPRGGGIHLEKNESSNDIDLEPPMLLYTRMTNFSLLSHQCHQGCHAIVEPLSGLHDSLTWSLQDSLPDGQGGLTSGCRLTCSVGNRSVPAGPYQMHQTLCQRHGLAL